MNTQAGKSVRKAKARQAASRTKGGIPADIRARGKDGRIIVVSSKDHPERAGAAANPYNQERAVAFHLLGGTKMLDFDVQSPLDAHELLKIGLPSKAAIHLVDRVGLLHNGFAVQQALGMSLRTLQRRKDEPDGLLNREQSGRTWKFAEILARASSVLGSQAEAEEWLQLPAMALNDRTPLELLETTAGVELVEDHLGRMEYGVYT